MHPKVVVANVLACCWRERAGSPSSPAALRCIGARAIAFAWLIGLALCCAMTTAQAQVALESADNAVVANSGPVGNGPSATAQVITLRHNTDNPSGNAMTARTPAVTATISLTNHQFTGLTAAEGFPASTGGNGVYFGAGVSSGGNPPNPQPLYRPLNAAGTPPSANFTSVNAASGQGIDSIANAGVLLSPASQAIFAQAPATPTNARVRMADLVITFSTPVTDPIVHIAGMGGTTGSLGFAAEFDLVTSGLSLTRLSGNAVFVVSGSQINTTASAIGASCTTGVGACGSVRVNGTAITTVTLRVFLRGDAAGGSWGSTGSVSLDQVLIGVSVNEPTPTVTVRKVTTGGVGTFDFTGTNGYTATSVTTVTAGTAVAGTTRTLSAAGTETIITEATTAGYRLTGITCTGMGSGGTATVGTLPAAGVAGGGAVTLNAAATALGSNIVCTFANERLPVIRVQKSLPIGRKTATDQFTLRIASGATILQSATTTGATNTPAESATLGPATPGTTYTLSEIASGTTNLAEYSKTYSCTNTRVGGTAPSGNGASFTVSPAVGDDLTCTFSNSAPPPPPFTCDATLYLSQVDRLYTVNSSGDPFTYATLGPVGTAFNALAYNPRDNYLYALRNQGTNAGSAELYRIGTDGVQVLMGTVSGLPTAEAPYFSAAFTTANDDLMYVMDADNSDLWYRINVSTLVATERTLSRPLYVADFDFANGLFYGVETFTGQLVSIHPGTGVVTNLGDAGPTGAVGAIWADSGGLYGALNAGGFFRFDPVSGSRTLISHSAATNSNDGARCPLGPPLTFSANLAITKTNTPAQGANDLSNDTYSPGESRSYSIVVTNNGPFGAQNVTVADPLPAGITSATWTCANTSGDAACGAASGTNAINDNTLDLPADAVATYTLTFTVPANFTGALTNVATVSVGSGNTDPTTSNNSATDTDTRAPQLTLAKSWINARISDAATISTSGTPAPTGSGALAAVANAATETDTATGRYSLQAGQTYTITEAFSVGNASGYTKTLSCTGNTGTGAALAYTANALSGTLTVGSTATDIACTFANTGTATLSLVKTVTNDNGGTQLATAWTLAAAGPTNISGTTGAAAVTNASVNPGTYTLSESATPTGYTASTYSCIKNGGAAVVSNSIALVAGDVATCTINNNDRPATLSLVKTVTNDNGGTQVATAWTLSAAGPTNISGATGTAAVTNATVNPGTYTLSESATPTGYTASTYSCIKNGGAAVVSNSIALVAGDVATCTINNNDRPATLTLAKTVTNDNGGTQLATAWTLSAAGPTNISGATGAAAVTNASVNPGTYTLSESATPTGYTASTYSCIKNGGAAVVSNSIALVAGDVASCTINNNDRPATLSLAKTVTNDNGGTQLATAWTLAAAGPTNISGATGTAAVTNATVNPGTYTLSESATPTGYTASTYSCIKNGGAAVVSNSIALVAGDVATCTINNNDRPATLTLAKTVTNDNGGTQLATAWTLSAAGPTNISGATGAAAVTNASVSPGTYTLSESATPTGYTASTYSCIKNGGAAVVSNSIALVAGDVAGCTINNNDRPATLSLVKTVTNDNGGTQLATAWTLAAVGPTNISGATGTAAVTNASVNPGTYTLSESATPTGYTASTYSCIKNGGAAVAGNSIALVAGDVASCTINNNDSNQTDVEIEKTATPNPVRAGAQVQFTLVVNNRGPAAAHGAILRDPATAGLDCTAASLPSTSCSATGGATCPAPLTASGLQAGVAIPALPNGGAVTIVLTCNVTASGVP